MSSSVMKMITITEENTQLLDSIDLNDEQINLLGEDYTLFRKRIFGVEGRLVESYAISENEKIFGFFRLIFPFNKTECSLSGLMISKEFQDRGLGFRSMVGIIEKVKCDFPNAKELSLVVHQSNTAAISLYTKLNFKDLGNWKSCWKIMSKDLR